MPKFRVALVGLNSLFGRVSSLLLKQSPLIKCVKLYDVTNINAALDVSSVNTGCQVKAFLGEEQLDKALLDTDIIVIGEESREGLSNDENYLGQLASKYRTYANAIANSSPEAVIVVASNSLNTSLPLLSQLLAQQGCYNCDRVVGATSVDTVRANAILANHLDLDPKDVVLPVIGGSSEHTRVPIFSHARPQFSLDQATKDMLTERIKTEDKEIKALKGTPETLNKSYATMKFLNSLMRGLQGEKNVSDIALSKTDLVPGVEYFSLPVILGKGGIVHRFGIPKVTELEQNLVKSAIVSMKKEADRAALVLKGGDPELEECQFLSDEDKASKQKELFDLFVTTLDEVEEEFKIAFQSNQRTDFARLFKNRQSRKSTRKAGKGKKVKTNPLKALLPLKKSKKKVAENIVEGFQKKLQPRLSNSIAICEPLACPDCPPEPEPVEEIVEEPEKIEDEVPEVIEKKGVVNAFYSHNCNFVDLKEKPVECEGKAVRIAEVDAPKVQRASPSTAPTVDSEKTVQVKRKAVETREIPSNPPEVKCETEGFKENGDKLDKVTYYIEKLKQCSDEISRVQNSGVVYRYNSDNQVDWSMAEKTGREEIREIIKKPAPMPIRKPAVRKNVFKAFVRRERAEKTAKKELKPIVCPLPIKTRKPEAKRAESEPLTRGKGVEGEEKKKFAEAIEPEKSLEKKKTEESVGKFLSEEEIVGLSENSGLFRSEKREALNSCNVSDYMIRKMRSEEKAKEKVVTRRKYVLSGVPFRQNDNSSKPTSPKETKAVSERETQSIPEMQKESEEIKTIAVEKTEEGVKSDQSEEPEKVPESPQTQKSAVRVESSADETANAKEIQGEEAAVKVEAKKESDCREVEKATNPTEESKTKESDKAQDALNATFTPEVGEFTEYDEKRFPDKDLKMSAKLFPLKAFLEKESRIPVRAAIPEPHVIPRKSIFSYTNVTENLDIASQNEPMSQEGSKNKSAPFVIKANKTLRLPKLNIVAQPKATGNIYERITRQIKENLMQKNAERSSNEISPLTAPYYSIKSKNISLPENSLKGDFKKAKSSQIETRVSENLVGRAPKKVNKLVKPGEALPPVKGHLGLRKPLRKIDILSENKQGKNDNSNTKRRTKRPSQIPQRNTARASSTVPQNWTLSVKVQPKGSIKGIPYESLSTIDFARYWKKREKEEINRQYPCPVRWTRTVKTPSPVKQAAQETPSRGGSRGAVEPPKSRGAHSSGTCADLIRGKRQWEGRWSDSYDKHLNWTSNLDTPLLSRLCVSPFGLTDRRFEEYSTCHIPSLKQTEEQYFLEERYE